jgi:SsrA-binding protein
MSTVVARLPTKVGPPLKGFNPFFLPPFLGALGAKLCFGFLIGAGVIKILYSIGMTLVEYKKALLKFAPIETFSAGIELLGTEVKALRSKLGSLDGARVVVRGGEAYIIGMTIPPYQMANTPKTYDPERARRLLLTKKELNTLFTEEAKKGLTIVPLEVYSNGRLVKARIAIVRGKGKSDRREDLKKRDATREIGRTLKQH